MAISLLCMFAKHSYCYCAYWLVEVVYTDKKSGSCLYQGSKVGVLFDQTLPWYYLYFSLYRSNLTKDFSGPLLIICISKSSLSEIYALMIAFETEGKLFLFSGLLAPQNFLWILFYSMISFNLIIIYPELSQTPQVKDSIL